MMMTEAGIQRLMYNRFGHQRAYCMPNVYVFANESDLLTVTKAGYTDEYEIKLSRSDFMADKRKHRYESYHHVSPWHGLQYSRRQDDGTQLHWTGIRPRKIENNFPNRFWYVVPEGLVTADEVPAYAGLMYITQAGQMMQFCKKIKNAPKLHGKKAGPRILDRINKSAYFRYTNHWISQ